MAANDTHSKSLKESQRRQVDTKRIMTGVFCILILSGAVSAQKVTCQVQFGTCPPDYPPDADVIVMGGARFRHAPDFILQDADWYFYDRAIGSWTLLDHSQIQPLASGVFDDEFDQVIWEEYLKDADTSIAVTADKNRIYVMDEVQLHLINVLSGIVLTLPYSEWVQFCETRDGTSINWFDWVYEEGAHVFRCQYSFHFAMQRAELRIINDTVHIMAGALNVLDATSPFEYEKVRARLEHHLDPPEIWFFDSSDYNVGFEYYLRLDGTYADDLNGKTIGPQQFTGIALHHRLVRVVDLGQREYEDLGGRERKSLARNALVSLIDSVLALTPGKWLIWVETGDDNILIRNLSTIHEKEEKQ